MSKFENLPAPMEPSAVARMWAGLVSVAVVAGVLSPITQNWRKAPQDSFPLSYYSMFTRSRGASAQVTYLVAVDDQGRHHRLHHGFVGTGGLNQVRKQINHLVREGQVEKLCQIVGANIARLNYEPFTRLVEVHVVTGSYDFDTYFRGDKTPLAEHLHAAYLIPRRPDQADDGGHSSARGNP